MYQTRGLFYPSLSQRVYQSNQGLKLAAKAVCHPKGEFICLKSFLLPNDSNIDMKHNRHCFLLFLLSPCPLSFSAPSGPCLFGRRWSSGWYLPCPPAAPRFLNMPAPGCSCQDRVSDAHCSPLDLSWQNLPVSTPSLSLPIQARSLRNMNDVKNYPLLVTGIRWRSFRCMLSLLFSDRQLCFTLIVIYLLSSSL